MRCDNSDMVGIGFWDSRVLEGKMRETGGRKLRGLMVYEKAGLPFLKYFLFISQLFCCAFSKCPKRKCPRVCSIFTTMSQHLKIFVTTEFCNHSWTRSVKCRDITRNVVTLFFMLLSIYVATMKNLCRDIKCHFQFETKIDYVAT